VEIAGKDLLAGAGLTGKQHGGIGFGHLVGQGQQVAGMGVGSDHAVMPDELHGIALHVLEQHIGFERFHQEITGAAAHRIHGLFDVTEGGHQQNRKLRQALTQLRQGVEDHPWAASSGRTGPD
jgi:hypothetical protein